MCNTSPPFSPSKKPHLLATNAKAMEEPPLDLHEDLRRWPTPTEVVEELRAIAKISIPTTFTGLVIYSRAMISMLFLGYLGELELAGGSLSIGFANITGYSVLSGLAMGMEPICSQAFGAKQRELLGLTLQRTVLLLLSASVPIAFLWLNMRRILLWCGQDAQISAAAQLFIAFAIPDLALLSFLHPLRIYLRSQGITLPVTYCSLASVLLHVPLNYCLVVRFRMGIAGVAFAMVWTNLNLLLCLLLYILCSGVHRDSWVRPSADCLHGWAELLRLAIPTCVSVCLEWWWYELMIIMCGLLANPKATVAAMGILIQTTSLVYVFPSSLSLAVSTRVGNELGAGQPARARRATVVALGAAVALALAAMAFTASVRLRWGRLFTDDAEILKLTAAALPIVGLCELGNCPQTTGCGVLRGCARPSTSANINLGAFYLVGTPVAVAAGFVARVGFPGLWLGLLTAQASCAGLITYAIYRTDWAGEVERARALTTTCSNSSTIILPTTVDSNGDGVAKESKQRTAAKLEEIVCDHDAWKTTAASETDPLISRSNETSEGAMHGRDRMKRARERCMVVNSFGDHWGILQAMPLTSCRFLYILPR